MTTQYTDPHSVASHSIAPDFACEDAPPPLPLGLHPLEEMFRPIVATRAIERLADAINSALDAAYRGIGVYGRGRIGKSDATRYLQKHVKWLKSRQAAILVIDAPEDPKRTVRGFYSSLLTLLGVRAPARAQAEDLLMLVVATLIESCQGAKRRMVILFFDEAQRLMPADYERFVAIDNAMTRAGYYLFVVSVHQSDVTGFDSDVFSTDDYPPHVSGRYLVRKHEHTGINNVEEAAYVCARYDTGTEWPAGSGVSHTAHFAPTAFANGFRLSHYAARLWEAASNLRAGERLNPEWSWPMKTFEGTIVYLLVQVAARNPAFEGFSDADIDKALYASGFLELEKSRHTYKPVVKGPV